MKQLTRLIALVLCVGALLFTIFLGTQALKNADSDRYEYDPLPPLTIQVLDVGKGDAILVTCEEDCMVIDTGYDDTAPLLLDALDAAGVDQVDTLIITHFDKDHVGGADKLLKAIPVETIYAAPYTSDSKQYKQFVKAAKLTGREIQPVSDMITFTVGGASCKLYGPLLDEYDQENDYSLALSMRYGADSFLFTGDAENERQQEMMSQMPLEHSFLKVPHHGRIEDNSLAFLRAVSPQLAVITCSVDQPADDAILQDLDSIGAETYLTSGGTVTVVSEGTGEMAVSQG